MSERYDYREDEDSDIHHHDNPDHQGYHSYEVDLQETDDQLQNWQEETD